MADERHHTVIIGVVAVQFAIPVDDGIYRPDGGGFFVDDIQIRHDGLFIGNGNVDALERPGLQKGRQLGRGQLFQLIIIIGQIAVDLFGKAMGQLFAN